MIKRLISEESRRRIKNLRKYKDKNDLSQAEINDLVIIIAKKLGLL
jgi:hypothetical protein